jgi:hypothetical protein
MINLRYVQVRGDGGREVAAAEAAAEVAAVATAAEAAVVEVEAAEATEAAVHVYVFPHICNSFPVLYIVHASGIYEYGSNWVVSMISSDLIPCMCTSFRTFTIDS